MMGVQADRMCLFLVFIKINMLLNHFVEIRWVQLEAGGNIFSILYISFKTKIGQLSVTGLSN